MAEALVAALVIVFVAIGTMNLLIGVGGVRGELEHDGIHTVFEDVLSEILLIVVGASSWRSCSSDGRRRASSR